MKMSVSVVQYTDTDSESHVDENVNSHELMSPPNHAFENHNFDFNDFKCIVTSFL